MYTWYTHYINIHLQVHLIDLHLDHVGFFLGVSKRGAGITMVPAVPAVPAVPVVPAVPAVPAVPVVPAVPAWRRIK